MATNATANLSGFLRRLTVEMAAETLSNLSDQQLIAKALAGCGEAVFQTLVRRHGTMVYGVCWRVLRHEADAEDAFQATFFRSWGWDSEFFSTVLSVANRNSRRTAQLPPSAFAPVTRRKHQLRFWRGWKFSPARTAP